MFHKVFAHKEIVGIREVNYLLKETTVDGTKELFAFLDAKMRCGGFSSMGESQI
jgi:hypothetical protein